MKTFVSRRLKLKFELAQGSFTGRMQDNAVEFSGLRVHADIEVWPNMTSQAHIVVFGLKQETMNTLTLVQAWTAPNSFKKNYMALYSTDENGVDTLVFDGEIFQAIADYNGAPQVPFHIFAKKMYPLQLIVPPPLSFPGTNKAADIIQTVLNRANTYIDDSSRHYRLENNGVDASLTDVSLSGPLFGMLIKVTNQANAMAYADGNIVSICPRDKARGTKNAERLELSTATGMIGYPITTPIGAVAKALFNPYYRPLGKILLKSTDVTFRRNHPEENPPSKAGSAYYLSESEFFIASLKHRLQSETPGGAWETEMVLYYLPFQKES